MSNPPCQLCSQPSMYYCACKNPPVPCCHACSYRHHESPGAHIWGVFGEPEKKQISCSVCQERPAEFVCCCRFPVAPLCSQCRVQHIVGVRLVMHIEQPTEKAGLIKSFEDIERARRVLENKDRIEMYLNQNKDAAEKLKEKVTNLAENWITQINAAKEATLKEINKVERGIEQKRKSLKETVESYLFQVEVQCIDALLIEAFDTLTPFTCTEILQGELQKIDQIGPLIAQLHIPSYLEALEAELQPAAISAESQPPSEVLAPASSAPGEEVNAQAANPSEGAESLPLAYSGEPATPGEEPQQDSLHTHPSYPRHEEAPAAPTRPRPSDQLELFEVTQEMRESVHAPCREDFHSRTPEIPITIGRHRLPIESLWAELMVEEVQPLAEKFSTWRRSRGDGNSFYRCVGVLLCEHYCRPDTPIAEVATICRTIHEQRQPFVLMSDSIEVLGNIKLWQRMLKDIYTTRTRGENAFQRLQYFLQKPKFDRAIIIAMRNYTAAYCKLRTGDPEVAASLPKSPETLIQEIMQYETEAEVAVLAFTAQAFNVILRIFTFDIKSGHIPETTYGPAAKGWYPSMHLLRLPAHYNYLVPRARDHADHYDFAPNTYSPVPIQKAVDYEEYVLT